MQHMPDKEFDKLFKDKFADAEIEPSTNLWANIEQQLEPKRKLTIPIFWMAAASVAIAITAMLVFQKTEKIQLRGADEITNVTKPSATQNVTNGDTDVNSTSPVATTIANDVIVAKSAVKAAVAKTPENKAPENNLKNINESVQPMLADNRLPIKQQEVRPLDVAPIKEAQAENPIVIAKVEPQQNVADPYGNDEVVTEKKGIRNVGDLVNFVVDKVDKRDKKLLKFKTDDDDNSSIVGINIGFLKFNKKNK